MSKGPGHVERKLRELFKAQPFGAFSVGTLCLHVWPELTAAGVQHKHRVSVARAMERVEIARWHGFLAGHEKLVYAGPHASRAAIQAARGKFAARRGVI